MSERRRVVITEAGLKRCMSDHLDELFRVQDWQDFGVVLVAQTGDGSELCMRLDEGEYEVRVEPA